MRPRIFPTPSSRTAPAFLRSASPPGAPVDSSESEESEEEYAPGDFPVHPPETVDLVPSAEYLQERGEGAIRAARATEEEVQRGAARVVFSSHNAAARDAVRERLVHSIRGLSDTSCELYALLVTPYTDSSRDAIARLGLQFASEHALALALYESLRCVESRGAVSVDEAFAEANARYVQSNARPNRAQGNPR